MAINVDATGPYQYDSNAGMQTNTSRASYSYFSGELITTDSFDANECAFGVGLVEIHIVNSGSNPIAFQFPHEYGTNKASGMVPASSSTTLHLCNKTGLKVRSLVNGQQSNKVYVFGI